MKTNLKRSSSGGSTRQAFLTLQGWALGTLIDQGAVTECDHHGHRKDRSDPDAWREPGPKPWAHPFPGATPEACLKARL